MCAATALTFCDGLTVGDSLESIYIKTTFPYNRAVACHNRHDRHYPARGYHGSYERN
jgi:hypothetical protein